jgi:hypothetical protein
VAAALGLVTAYAGVGVAAVAASCAAAQLHVASASAQTSGVVVAELPLPLAPPGSPVLRVTITPTGPPDAWPALLQPSLRIGTEPHTEASLPPWTLYPSAEQGTFSLRLTPIVERALQAGEVVTLTLRAIPLATDGVARPAPSFDVSVTWATSNP